MNRTTYNAFVNDIDGAEVKIYLFDGTPLNISYQEAYNAKLPCIYRIHSKSGSRFNKIYVGYSVDGYHVHYLQKAFYTGNLTFDKPSVITKECQKTIDYYRLMEKV